MLHSLLERWSKLESDRCQIIRYEDGVIAFRVGKSPMLIAPDSEDPDNWAWTTSVIQGAVQDAIVARDGGFVIESAVPPGFGIIARVSGWNTPNYAGGYHSYGGIALLSAYLDWLEEALTPKVVAAQPGVDEIPF